MKPIKTLCAASLLIGLIMALTACGFHLRRPVTFNSQLETIYISTTEPNSAFIQTLKRTLLANGLKLTTNPDTATAILHILNIQETNQLTSLRGGGSAGEYTSSATITFSVTNADGQTLLAPNTVTQSSNYSSNATQVLSSGTQSQELISQMQQNLADKIISQLTAIQAPVADNDNTDQQSDTNATMDNAGQNN